MSRSSCAWAVAALVACATPTAAHDFWVQPAAYLLPTPGLVRVDLHVGHDGELDTLVRHPDHLQRFESVGPRGVSGVDGRWGAAPAGRARCDAPGVHVLVYASKPSEATHELAAFRDYLREEGLLDALAAVAGRDDATPIRERYRRATKALLQVGGGRGRDDDRRAVTPVGLDVEVVPEVPPWTPGVLARGLPVRVLADGRPVRRALVDVQLLDAPSSWNAFWTDDDGRAVLPITGPGQWLVSTVHIAAPREPDGVWESVWSSLSFEVSPGDRGASDDRGGDRRVDAGRRDGDG